MSDVNHLVFSGRLTADPTIKSIPQDGQMTAVANMRVASNETYGSGDSRHTITTFADVEAWGRQAENVATYCKKGKRILVEGRLKLDTWEDKKTRTKRSVLRIKALNITFLDAAGPSTPADADDDQVPSGSEPSSSSGG